MYLEKLPVTGYAPTNDPQMLAIPKKNVKIILDYIYYMYSN